MMKTEDMSKTGMEIELETLVEKIKDQKEYTKGIFKQAQWQIKNPDELENQEDDMLDALNSIADSINYTSKLEERRTLLRIALK